MQYQRLTDDASIIIGETGESQLWSSSLDTNRNVCHVRRTILILLLIQLSCCAFLLMMDGRLLNKDNVENYRQGIRSFAPILLSTIYYGCGLCVIYQYHHLGIYVFAWLGILQYVSLCAEVFLNIVFIIKHPSHDTQTKLGIRLSLSIAMISTCQTVLLVITLKLSFKLLRLIKIFKRDVLEQM